MASASATLRQSTNWRSLFELFPPLAQVLNWLPAPMQKGVFLGFFTRSCLQGNESSCTENVMKVISSHVTTHRSRNEPSNVRDGDCRDGDKLLCNTG